MRVCRVELRTGTSVTTTVTTRTVKSLSCARMRGRVLSPGARSRMEQFYEQIDEDLDAEDCELDVWDSKRDRKVKRANRRAKRMRELLRERADYWRSVAARANFQQRQEDAESAPSTGGTDSFRPHSRKFRKHHKRQEDRT